MHRAAPRIYDPKPTPDAIAQETHDIPVAMQVLPKIKKLLKDGGSSLFSIVALLRLDLGLTVRILRVSNSAYYNRGNKCQTLEEAVHRLGYNHIYEIVAYAVASQVLDRPVQTYDLEVNDLWQRSVACALASKELAAKCGADSDEAYTIGLLHNVGLVAIDNWVMRNCPGKVYFDRGFPEEWSKDESEHLGLSQEEVGSTLLTQWDFPKSITSPVRWQRNPRGSDAYEKLANILVVSRWIRAMIYNQRAQSAPPPDARILSELGVNSIGLREIINHVRASLVQVNNLLETKQTDLQGMSFPARTDRAHRIAAAS